MPTHADTRGYSDSVFALCHLLGFGFAPRLKDLSERRLFWMRRNLGDYSVKTGQLSAVHIGQGGLLKSRSPDEH